MIYLDRKELHQIVDTEIRAIKSKYNNAGYLIHFIASIKNNFNLSPEDDASVIISPNLFDEMKPFLMIEVPCCEINETASTHLIKMFHQFTTEKFDITLNWTTRKVKSLFKVKDKNLHPSCKIHKGECTCGETCVGETVRNVEVRGTVHNNTNKNQNYQNIYF